MTQEQCLTVADFVEQNDNVVSDDVPQSERDRINPILCDLSAATGDGERDGRPGEQRPITLYNDFYNHFNSDSEVSFSDTSTWAYWATGSTGWGGIVGLGNEPDGLDEANAQPASPGFELTSAAVIMSNWNGWDPDGGPGRETDPYSHAFTLELYEVDRSGEVPRPGSKIDEITEEQQVPGRQIPDSSNDTFVGNGTNFLMEWDLPRIPVLSDELLFVISFTVDGGNEEALKSLNIASYDDQVQSTLTAGYSANDDIWWRPIEGFDFTTETFNNSAFDANSITSFNSTDLEGIDQLGGGQPMSRFQGVPLTGEVSNQLDGR